MPPNPNTPPEITPPIDPEEAARKRTIEGVHSSLESLRAQINQKNPGVNFDTLMNELKNAADAHTDDKSERWKKLQQALAPEFEAAKSKDKEALVKALKEQADIPTELLQLTDELGATAEYLKIQEEAKPQDQKIWDKVTSEIEKRAGSSKTMKKLKEWGISIEDIRNWIVNLIAGILEGFPIGAMSKISGGLRFRAALDDAKKDKLLTAEDKKLVEDPKKEFRHEDGTTQTLEDLWMTRYEEWLTRKRAASGAFKETPPTIRSVLHPPKGPSIAQAPSDKLFGIDGLRQGGSVEIASGIPQTIQVNNDKIEINRLDDRAQITINGTKKFKINHSLKGITLQAPSANAGDVVLNAKVEPNDVISSSLTAILTSAQPDKDFTVETGGKKLNFIKIPV